MLIGHIGDGGKHLWSQLSPVLTCYSRYSSPGLRLQSLISLSLKLTRHSNFFCCCCCCGCYFTMLFCVQFGTKMKTPFHFHQVKSIASLKPNSILSFFSFLRAKPLSKLLEILCIHKSRIECRQWKCIHSWNKWGESACPKIHWISLSLSLNLNNCNVPPTIRHYLIPD